MLTICVVTGPEHAEGFRLAGIDVAAAGSQQEALDAIEIMLAAGNCGILVVDDEIYEGIGEGHRKRFERAGLPVIVPLPLRNAWRPEEQSMEYLLRLIRRSIGYHMRLKK